MPLNEESRKYLGPVIHHKNGDPHDNHLDNLEVVYRDPYEDPEPLAAGPWCCDRPRIQVCACLEHSVCDNCGDGLPCGDDCLFPIPCPECGNPNSEDWRECAALGCATTKGD